MNNDAGENAGPPGADELLELLARQQELYGRLRQLARQQRDLIGAADPSGLLGILSRRQGLIEQLGAINRRLEPARADWKRIESLLTDEQRGRAAAMIEQVGRLLAEILQSDEADTRLLSARKALTGRQVQAAAAEAQVQAAYRRAAQTPHQPSTGAALDHQSS